MPRPQVPQDLVDSLFESVDGPIDPSVVQEPIPAPQRSAAPHPSGGYAAHTMPQQTRPPINAADFSRSTVTSYDRKYEPVPLTYSAAPRVQMACMYAATFLVPHLLGCILKSTPLGMWENFGIGLMALAGAVYWFLVEQVLGTPFARKNPWVCNMTLHIRVASGALGLLSGFSGALNVFRGMQMFQGATPW